MKRTEQARPDARQSAAVDRPLDKADEAGSAGRSRRRFLKLFAAGSAAALAGGIPAATVRAAAPAPKRKPAFATPAMSHQVRAEIESQKEYIGKALKTIREFPLAPGSDMAFVFAPRKAGPRTSRAKSGDGR